MANDFTPLGGADVRACEKTLIGSSVLYQRGIYPPEDFKVVKKYGLNVLVTTDDEVKSYIKRIMGQLSRKPLYIS